MGVRKAKIILKEIYKSVVWDKKRKVFKTETHYGQHALVIL